MDIKELQPLLKRFGSVLVVQDGEPAYVFLGWDVFRQMVGPSEQAMPAAEVQAAPERVQEVPVTVERGPQRKPVDARETEVMERLNNEIQALKDQLTADQERVERSLEDLWPSNEGSGDGQTR